MTLKQIILTTILIFSGKFSTLLACTVCKANQPKMLENITHGAGPSGSIDYIITWSALVIVGITLYLSIKRLVRPQEHQSDHIKNIVLHEDFSY